jgi:hypothetical protein
MQLCCTSGLSYAWLAFPLYIPSISPHISELLFGFSFAILF